MHLLPRRSRVAVLGPSLACVAVLATLAGWFTGRGGAAAQTTPELLALPHPAAAQRASVPPTPTGRMARYSEAGNWTALWWLPEIGDAAVPGTQVAVEKSSPHPLPHLIFVPPGSAPPTGWPTIVFLHGQGESSPSPLPMVALQGPPQHAGRHPSTLPFVVLSPQKPMRSQFYDDDVAAGVCLARQRRSACACRVPRFSRAPRGWAGVV